MDATPDAELQRKARRLDKTLRKSLRNAVLARDVSCRLHSGDWPIDAENLVLAHITPMKEFRDHLGLLEGTRHSYRLDNVLTLCILCHAIQESVDRNSHQPLTAKLRDFLAEEYPGRKLHQDPEFRRQYDKIQTLFAQLRKQRGWTTAQDLIAREKLTPAPKKWTWEIIDEATLPAGQTVEDPRLQAALECITRVGGRVLRQGRIANFTTWYEAQTGNPYRFAFGAVSAVVFQRPLEESLIGKLKRAFERTGAGGSLLQLKVSPSLYLLHVLSD